MIALLALLALLAGCPGHGPSCRYATSTDAQQAQHCKVNR